MCRYSASQRSITHCSVPFPPARTGPLVAPLCGKSFRADLSRIASGAVTLRDLLATPTAMPEEEHMWLVTLQPPMSAAAAPLVAQRAEYPGGTLPKYLPCAVEWCPHL